MLTYSNLDRIILERVDGYQISSNDFKRMAIDRKDETSTRRCVDQPNEVSFAFLEDFAEDWLAILCRDTPSWRIR